MEKSITREKAEKPESKKEVTEEKGEKLESKKKVTEEKGEKRETIPPESKNLTEADDSPRPVLPFQGGLLPDKSRFGNIIRGCKRLPSECLPKLKSLFILSRPKTGFQMWLEENRSCILAENPDFEETEIIKEGMSRFRTLSAEERMVMQSSCGAFNLLVTYL